MSVELLVKRKWTPADKLAAMEAPGRPARRIAGGWIADLTGLRKCIVLCGQCTHKFNPKLYHYRKETEMQASGRCDGCKAHDIRCTLYVADETYNQVRMTRADTRAMASSGYTFVSG